MTSSTIDRRYGVIASAAIKVACAAATTANITLSGEQTIDGVSCVTDDRVLVKDQSTASENGIYVVDTGSWTRDLDWDGTYDVKKGTLVYVNSGTANAGLFYVVTTADPITVGTTSVSMSVVSPSSPLTLPLSLANGGTGVSAASNTGVLAALGVIQCASVAGTANAITCAISSLSTAYRTDQVFQLTPTAVNTGAVTVTPTPTGGSALAAKNVFSNGSACVGGELSSGVPVYLHNDGTQLNIIGAPLSSGVLDLSSTFKGQIKFPAAQRPSTEANVLDDYEEGTWTPGIAFSGSTTVTYTSQTGSYTKIGRLIYAQFQVIVSSISTSAGLARLTGLPFAAKSEASGGGYLSDFTGMAHGFTHLGLNVNATTDGSTTGVATFRGATTTTSVSMSNRSELDFASGCSVAGFLSYHAT